MNMLSRNIPLAFVVGAAGFIGSNLVDKLLEKGIQVIGVDDLSTGRKENLAEAVKNKNFHFFHQSMVNGFSNQLPRLDYAFFIINENVPSYIFESAFKKFLDLSKLYQSKMVLVSTIDLYDEKINAAKGLKDAEKVLAKFCQMENTNGRVVRLCGVYGPRMNFESNDPIVRLIQSAVAGDLQKENIPLDFSSRALYIDDVTSLLIKAIMHGATAQKIYDGALLSPLSVIEIKQILLDPLWYENKGFNPTELPPWRTPNLIKTQKELSWKPTVGVVKALKHTVTFFKEQPDYLKSVVRQKIETNNEEIVPQKEPEDIKSREPQKETKIIKKHNFNFKSLIKNLNVLLGTLVIGYALIYPLILFWLGIFLINGGVRNTQQSILTGHLDQALRQSKKTEQGAKLLNEILSSLIVLEKNNWTGPKINKLNSLLQSFVSLSKANSNSVYGSISLLDSMQIISGEKEGNLAASLEQARWNFDNSLQKLDTIAVSTTHEGLLKIDPTPVSNTSSTGRITNTILTGLINPDRQNSYLVLLLDSQNLTAIGGKIISFAQVDFNKGKMANIKIGESDEILKKFSTISFDADFPSTAKNLEWVYLKNGGVRVDGVITFNSQMLGQGGVNKKTYENFLNKLFFSPAQNLPQMVSNLAQALEKKQMMIYVSNPIFASYLNDLNFSGVFPKQENDGQTDFISIYETSSDITKTQRLINLETKVTDQKTLNHKLDITHTSYSDVYQNQLRVYLPAGSKVTTASLDGVDVLKKLSSFTDYGRSVYQIALDLRKEEQKILTMEYQNPKILTEKDSRINYLLKVFKQPGTQADKFNLKINVPSGYRITSPNNSFSSDLSQDRQFEVVIAH